ncbi:hypothetical protein ACWDZ4_02320 [Streptomyces sp. NPDC003016]
MSMPPSPQQPPGPYGPPQPLNPYGGQPPQPQYAGQEQQPYPQQQPYPGQGGWGRPPLGPPPPRKNRTGMVIGIVAVSLVALGALGFTAKQLSAAGAVASGAGFPEAEYELTVPKTLLDGEYKLAQDMSGTEGEKALEGTYDPEVRDPKPAVGQYTSGPPTGPSVLVISGLYGQFKDPDEMRRKMLEGAEDGRGATPAVPAEEIEPAGTSLTLSCQVLTSTQNGAGFTMPMCAWADGNTGASVAVVTPEISQQDPESVDLAEIAEITVKVREETRRKAG